MHYPSSKSLKPALHRVSFSIAAGQIVVIVGANGSGKSSLVKLLSRLYDPSSGNVLFDGQPAQSYMEEDLHRACAVLSQEHHLLPGLSIAENIGLGDVGKVKDRLSVTTAAEKGGAMALLSKLSHGLDTVLEPMGTSYMANVPGTHSLRQVNEELEKRVDISGEDVLLVMMVNMYIHRACRR
jgi:ABC-type multidrug transport system fused ATPase/permease subunit